jgi:hypothetical protein
LYLFLQITNETKNVKIILTEHFSFSPARDTQIRFAGERKALAQVGASYVSVKPKPLALLIRLRRIRRDDKLSTISSFLSEYNYHP